MERNNICQSVEIICPLYNAENYIGSLHKSFLKQKKIELLTITYILTESDDSTEQYLKENKMNFIKITKGEFSHSLSREKAAMKSEADIIVFVTQDVVIERDDWLYFLIKDINSNDIVACYSRQLTKYDNIEKYTREKNYPSCSNVVSRKDIVSRGLNTFFFSDASSAINARVFKDLNGYDGKDLPTNEDMYLAYKLIMNGYSIKYCADSEVFHSHDFTLKQLFERYKLTGKFFRENSYLNDFGTNNSGYELAVYILKRICEEKKYRLLLRFPLDMASRYLGIKVGMFIR